MKKWIFVSLGVLVFVPVLVILIVLRHGFSDLQTKPYPIASHAFSNWEEVLAQAPKVEFKAMKTGLITGDRLQFVNQEHPDVDKIKHATKPVPVWSYSIGHEKKGDLLIDAGYSSLKNRSTINGTMKVVQWMNKGKNLQEPEQALEKQLEKYKCDPRKVFLTHFHPDHTAGVVVLDSDLDYIAGKAEFDFVGKAASGSYFKNRPNLYELDFEEAQSFEPFDKAIDLLGDGSLWAIATPGHTAGHVSYLAMTETGPVLMTGDACFYYDAWEHGIDPYCQNPKDQERAKYSLKQLKAFVKMYPQTKVYVGHDEKEL